MAVRTARAGSERWLTRAAAATACGVVALLFWSLSAGMRESSCRSAIYSNADCVNPGPSARILLAWSVLAAMGFAASLVLRRTMRRRRLVREGMNFTRSDSPTVLRSLAVFRVAGWCCWATAGAAGLALAVSGAGAVLGIVALVLAVSVVVLSLWGLRLRQRG